MIGIYDSGIGGLNIFNALKAMLPQENIHYFGDTLYFPFGDKSPEQVRKISLRSLQYLAKDCALIVIACNTSSVTDLDYYRKHISIPIIGIVPVIKTAAKLTNNNIIALLATMNTVDSRYTNQLIQQFAQHKQVLKIGCAGLADEIEHNHQAKTLQDFPILQGYLQQIQQADIVVLGCTHYTLIKGLIQQAVGPNVKVIDSTEAVARQVLRVMQHGNLLNPQTHPQYRFECSGNQERFLAQVKRYVAPL